MTVKITATRYHDFSMGHRVCGHKQIDNKGVEIEEVGPCSRPHGHNYRVFFTVEADRLDVVGRVLDFTAIKHILCQWLEDNWDHRFIMWSEDPLLESMKLVDASAVVEVPFNPTAENIGKYLIEIVAPGKLANTGTTLTKIIVEETRKCSAEVSL